MVDLIDSVVEGSMVALKTCLHGELGLWEFQSKKDEVGLCCVNMMRCPNSDLLT